MIHPLSHSHCHNPQLELGLQPDQHSSEPSGVLLPLYALYKAAGMRRKYRTIIVARGAAVQLRARHLSSAWRRATCYNTGNNLGHRNSPGGRSKIQSFSNTDVCGKVNCFDDTKCLYKYCILCMFYL